MVALLPNIDNYLTGLFRKWFILNYLQLIQVSYYLLKITNIWNNLRFGPNFRKN